ncbi:MAG: Gfo/Idh/MocA family oxidoreductase [Planctomycetia bacterium]|nr:Gfo/Idh/MocA family oxidoreductase [Planctomycetia bacterium]
MKTQRMRRREFLKTTSLGLGAGVLTMNAFPAPNVARASDTLSKINIAHVGIERQGAFSVNGCSGENQIAFCDVNSDALDRAKGKYPNAKFYNNYQDMLGELGDKLDAIVVATPDHTHACTAIAGMQLGLHCYCEKPLAHDIYQIRQMRKIALEKNLVTQMGTQIHAGDNFRRVVELLRAGAIGVVKDVKVWCANRYIGLEKPTETPSCPANINWDAWLGPAKERAYDPRFIPGSWRSYWDFGNGAMGDMACHYLDLPYWALQLDRFAPLTVETTSPNPLDEERCGWDLTAKYEFPALDGSSEPLTISWQDGQARPECLKEYGVDKYGAGVLFFGSDGVLFANYDVHELLPHDKFSDYKTPEQTIPASLGHHAEWIDAIKRGAGASVDSTTCRFEYSGKLAETVLLGCFAYRCGEKLQYDAENMTAKNCEKLNQFVRQYARPGWDV